MQKESISMKVKCFILRRIYLIIKSKYNGSYKRTQRHLGSIYETLR